MPRTSYPITPAHQHQIRRNLDWGGAGSTGADSTDPAGGQPGDLLATVARRDYADDPAGPVAEGATVRSRKVDPDGRVRVVHDDFAGALGWEAGDLHAVADGRWLALSQPSEFVGRTRRRQSSAAHLLLGGESDRLCLAPAHLESVGLGVDREILLMAIPDTGVLYVATAVTCALAALPSRFASRLRAA